MQRVAGQRRASPAERTIVLRRGFYRQHQIPESERLQQPDRPEHVFYSARGPRVFLPYIAGSEPLVTPIRMARSAPAQSATARTLSSPPILLIIKELSALLERKDRKAAAEVDIGYQRDSYPRADPASARAGLSYTDMHDPIRPPARICLRSHRRRGVGWSSTDRYRMIAAYRYTADPDFVRAMSSPVMSRMMSCREQQNSAKNITRPMAARCLPSVNGLLRISSTPEH